MGHLCWKCVFVRSKRASTERRSAKRCTRKGKMGCLFSKLRFPISPLMKDQTFFISIFHQCIIFQDYLARLEAIRRQNFQERKELQRRMAGVRAPVAPAVQVKSNSPGAHFSTVPKLFGRISWGQNSLCIFKKKASRATILGSYFNFDSLYNIWKDQLYGVNGLEFYEFLFGCEKFSGLSRNGPQNNVLFFFSRSTCVAWTWSKPACSLIDSG